jgi:hypothetical protein
MEFNLINNKQKPNNMKKVFSSHASLSHAWANQTHPIGKSSAMFFDGPVIYSYGYHYEIARFIQAPNGKYVVFINTSGYSVSTSKHTGHVISSIPQYITKFYVPFNLSGGYYQKDNSVSVEKLPAIIENMALNCKNLCFDQLKARTNTSYFRQAASLYSNILEICSLFNLQAPSMPDNYDEAGNKYDFLINTQTQRENIKAAKELEKSKELLIKWLNHEHNGQLYNIPVHLRISKDGQFIETTKGAKVDYLKGLELFNRLVNKENVNGHKINGFTLLENSSEALTIGCHVINWPVINQFFNK